MATSLPGRPSHVTPPKYCLSSFSVLNIAGLKPQTVQSKVPYVEALLKDKNQLFFGLTETWLKGHTMAEVEISGYKIYRADRKGRKHTRGRYSGGVALYLRKDIAATSEQIFTFSNGVVEVLATYSDKENLLVAVIYRQPDNSAAGHSSSENELNEALSELTKAIEKLDGTPDILFCGDFNLPNARWDNRVETPSCKIQSAMKDFQNEHFLHQVVNEATHRSGNNLDLVFTNSRHLISEITCTETKMSDHHIVEISTHFKSHFARAQKKHTKFHNTFASLNFFSEDVNWDQIKHDLQCVDWEAEFSIANDPANKIDIFTKLCEDIAVKHTPKKKVAKSLGRSKIPRERKVLMRRRTKVVKQLSKQQPPAMRNNLTSELVDIELKLQDSFALSNTLQENKAICAIKRNPKYFFTYVKKFSKSKPSVGPLRNADGKFVVDSKEMAELLSMQYSSVFSTPFSEPLNPDETFKQTAASNLMDFSFNQEDIIKSIDDISANAAAGPDGFPAVFLKKCKLELALPLYNMWRQYLDLGITPSSSRTSHIVPIHKGDSTAKAANYRPVALTSHLVKLFEKIVRARIVSYLEHNDLLNETQHGFRAGRSCLSQLIAHYDRILSLLDEGKNVDVIYLDFAKAFDKLDFNITLNKLSLLGINGKVGKWLHSFLTDRTQSVVVNGEKSDPAPVLSGVPQGSVIGPLLFLVLIGDIDKDVSNAFLSSFADDTRIGHGIASQEDARLLQEDLKQVYMWAEQNNMRFNSIKFELLRYGKNSNLKDSTEYVSNTGEIINAKESVKDLGVTMSSNANFKEHIGKVIDTVKELTAWILRSFRSRSPILMMQLWKSIVIPRLDYCSQLWNPHYVGQIQELEQLQRHFVKRIAGYQDMDYHTALKRLGLYSLQRRRERYQVIYLWSIIEGKVPNIPATNNTDLIRVHTSIESRNGRTIYIQPLKTGRYQTLRFNSLPFHGARLFNAMNKNVRNATQLSKDAFKNVLDMSLKLIPDTPLLCATTHSPQTNSLIDLARKFDCPTGTQREESALAGR